METDINASIGAVFAFVAAEDVLPKVLTGYGLLPSVVHIGQYVWIISPSSIQQTFADEYVYFRFA